MRQPLFDFDLKRVSREHYITGKAAIIFLIREAQLVGGTFCRTSTEKQEWRRCRLQASIIQIPPTFLAMRA